MPQDLKALTAKAKSLVRAGKYTVTRHATDDYPERKITAADILETLKIGSAVAIEPRSVDGIEKYSGDDRYRWFGEDQKDRVLRLIVIVEEQTVVVSAAEATPGQVERYRDEDEAALAVEENPE